MVSSKNLENLVDVFKRLSNEKSLDIYRFEGDLMDALFDLNTIETHVAGLTQRVIDNESLAEDEKASIPKDIFTEDKECLLPVINDRAPINIKVSSEVYEYAQKIDVLIKALMRCI